MDVNDFRKIEMASQYTEIEILLGENGEIQAKEREIPLMRTCLTFLFHVHQHDHRHPY